MRVIIDIEANSLTKPTKIHCIVCKDIDSGKLHVFRKLTEDNNARQAFQDFQRRVSLYCGHNFLGYDWPVLCNLLGCSHPDISSCSIDTLIVSKLYDYSRQGHSVEDYGKEFNIEKGIPLKDGELLSGNLFPVSFFHEWSLELENYCIRDVEITEKIYQKYKKFIKDNPEPIYCEQIFQLKVVNALSRNGFYFNIPKCKKYLTQVEKDLGVVDEQILKEFPPREVIVRTFTPKLTKHGTISRSSVPRVLHDRIHEYSADRVYNLTKFVEFNPSSHKQLIDVLTEAGWSPQDKTKTHLDTERRLNVLKRQRKPLDAVDTEIQKCHTDLIKLGKYGWKINENNLSTLPDTAPSSARALAKRILLEARRRTLTEWLGLVNPDTSRIHGKFYGIGAWTHRMAHQQPNTANIPNEFDTAGKKKLLGKEMRSLWCAPRNRLLVGVDAEGIQLRIFAHYIDDPEFTKALVEGKKDDKTDPHSLNQRILGSVCKSRAAAKRFVYALLLGAGIGKLAEILGSSEHEARDALERLMERYQGFTYLKETIIPADAKRGWFTGLDGRPVRIPGDTEGIRRHLCMSGYLQNGEAIIMKRAACKWADKLEDYNALLVNFVHDEWQTECPNNLDIALKIAKMQADSLRIVGEELKLKCPLAGSYWNDDLKDFTIATNWAYTH